MNDWPLAPSSVTFCYTVLSELAPGLDPVSPPRPLVPLISQAFSIGHEPEGTVTGSFVRLYTADPGKSSEVLVTVEQVS